MISSYRKKVKHIVPVWLTITAGVTAIVLVLRWLLTVKSQTVNLDEIAWIFWLPVLLSGLAIWFWLRPRLRVLTFGKSRENQRILFLLMPMVFIVATLIFAQQYLVEATARVTVVKTADEILTGPYSRYYRIEKFSVDRKFNGLFTTASTERSGGRFSFMRSKKEVFTLYWTVPFQLRDSMRIDLKLWYGITRKNTLTGSISEADRQYSADRFYQHSMQEIVNYNYHTAEYLKRLPAGYERTNFLRSVKQRISPVGDHIIILVPVTEEIAARTGDSLQWAIGWFIGGAILFLLMLTWPGFNDTQLKKSRSGRRT